MASEQAKVRVTFRIDRQLAAALRQLSNQTLFVESALLEALGESCPLCDGRGRVPARLLRISDFKQHGLPHLTADSARRLREVVRLGHQLMATDLKLAAAPGARGALQFELARQDQTLLTGRINEETASDFVVHN
jgi:hypothetical protein